jgi:hypothetical protein
MRVKILPRSAPVRREALAVRAQEVLRRNDMGVKKAGCDEVSIYRSHPFLVKDVLFSAILVAANEALLQVAGLVGGRVEDRALITDWIERGRRALGRCWDPELGLCLDYDLRAGSALLLAPCRLRPADGRKHQISPEHHRFSNKPNIYLT